VDEACHNWQQKRIKWLAEQEQVQKQLEETQNQLRKLNRNILSDIKLYKEWENMADAGMNNSRDALLNLLIDVPSGGLLDRYEHLANLPVVKRYATNPPSEAAKACALRIINTERLLSDFSLVRSFGDLLELFEGENETTPQKLETIRDTAGLVIGVPPWMEIVHKLNPEMDVKVFEKYSRRLKIVSAAWTYTSECIDLGYGLTQVYNSWQGVKQLDQNGVQHREVLKKMTERMKELVDRSRNLKKQLSASCE
jgi:hypothetical protein